MKPEYLLDECLSITEEEEKSGLYLSHNRFTYKGCIDDILLQKATDAGLTIITIDKGFVLRAIKYGINIIYQNKWGQRYYVYGSKTKYLGKIEQSYVPKKSNIVKKKELLASITSSRQSLFGFNYSYYI
jgi:hypothetical protein